MERSYIPFHVPSIGEEEIREVEATLRSGWLTTGPKTAQFEKEFAEYVGAPHAVALNSATAGLHLALAALNIGEGDEVITTPITFCSTVHAILHVGARPVLADIDSDGNIDPKQIEKAITDKTRAVLPVHMAGLPCDMNTIWDIARRHGLFVVEDAAHAVGSRYHGRQIGASTGDDRASDVVVFSFYATKNLTTGEGGMVTTPNESLAARIRMLSLHGMSRDAWNRYTERGSWYYEVIEEGFKYNLSDIQSSIGIHQLRKLESFIDARTHLADVYRQTLTDVDEVELPSRGDAHLKHSWHLYILRLNLDLLRIERGEFIEELRKRGIGASVHFIPIPRHPFFAQMQLSEVPCRRALELYPRIVSLPLYPAMTESQVRFVAEAVKQTISASRLSRSALSNAS